MVAQDECAAVVLLVAAGCGRSAVQEFDAALGLWRGPAYADVRDAAWPTPEIASAGGAATSVIGGRFTALLELARPARGCSAAASITTQWPRPAHRLLSRRQR